MTKIVELTQIEADTQSFIDTALLGTDENALSSETWRKLIISAVNAYAIKVAMIDEQHINKTAYNTALTNAITTLEDMKNTALTKSPGDVAGLKIALEVLERGKV